LGEEPGGMAIKISSVFVLCRHRYLRTVLFCSTNIRKVSTSYWLLLKRYINNDFSIKILSR
jgi:hypothetical protein